MPVMLELILLLGVLFVATLPPYLNLMQQRETQPAFKLSGNNSLLTLSNGTKVNLNIDKALIDLFDLLPKEIPINELHQHLFMIKDHITDNLPDDASIPLYKSMNAQLNAYANFFGALFFIEKGGSND